MNRTFATLATMILLCGCAGAPHRRPGTSPATGTPAATKARPLPSTRASGHHARPLPSTRDGGHVAACRDGDCEVTVRSGTTIPLGRRFGIGPITVTVDGDEVRLRAHSRDNDTDDTTTAPGTVTLNDVTVEILDAHDDVATLRVSHR